VYTASRTLSSSSNGGFLLEEGGGDALADPQLAIFAAGIFPREDLEERGLTGAVGPDDGDALPGVE
jgi:hypothetical protein